jgi:pimeloyl-ACP methyl ester carboxylesterase
MSMTKKKLIKWLKIIFIVYIIIGAALYFFQDKFLFHPKPLDADYKFSFSQPFEEVNLEVNAEKIISIIQFKVPNEIPKGVVLYFHGNKKNIERYAPYSAHFTRNKYEVWMIDYPGFGKTNGELTEEALYADAKLFYKLATSRFSKDSIILYGKSLGTGIASYLAAYRDCKKLILETPYTNMPDVMSSYAFVYPTTWMSKYEFPTIENLEKVKVPITILHGRSDDVIPFRLSEKLKKRYPTIDFVQIEKGKHNNLADFPLFQSKLDSLLSN